MPKVKVTWRVGLVGCERSAILEFGDEEWSELSEKDKNDACFERVMDDVIWDFEVIREVAIASENM